MGITIYDLRTSHNRHPEFGDFVMCQHCGRYMLVNFGEDWRRFEVRFDGLFWILEKI